MALSVKLLFIAAQDHACLQFSALSAGHMPTDQQSMVERSEVVSLNMHNFSIRQNINFPRIHEKWNGVVYPKNLQEEKKRFRIWDCAAP